VFLTIKASGNAIYKEKGSKFIGKAVSCSTGKQAVEIIAKTRKENPGCVHICYASALELKKHNSDLVTTVNPLIVLGHRYLDKLNLLN
jgi:putative IMPACT (imprinted ancient) family translation regulator